MKQTTALVGPRGWAALVLAGGAAFATPFLRTPPDISNATVADGSSNPDYSPTIWPRGKETMTLPSPAQSAVINDEAWQELSRMQTVSALPRPGSGALPTTTVDRFAPTLPSWAEQHRRVDQMVATIKPIAPLESQPHSVPDITPQRAWIDTPENFIGSSHADSLANSLSSSLPAANSNDPTDPFGRWTNSTQPQPSYASNQPVKPFEDRPKLWPDQKVQISEFARTNRPGISAIVQAESPQLHTNESYAAQSFGNTQPSAPRVGLSSASRREPMTASPNPPTNPPSPFNAAPAMAKPPVAPERPRQFIFQPSKKA